MTRFFNNNLAFDILKEQKSRTLTIFFIKKFGLFFEIDTDFKTIKYIPKLQKKNGIVRIMFLIFSFGILNFKNGG